MSLENASGTIITGVTSVPSVGQPVQQSTLVQQQPPQPATEAMIELQNFWPQATEEIRTLNPVNTN